MRIQIESDELGYCHGEVRKAMGVHRHAIKLLYRRFTPRAFDCGAAWRFSSFIPHLVDRGLAGFNSFP